MTRLEIAQMLDGQIKEEKASMLYMVLKEGDFETLYRYKHEEKNQILDMLKDYRYLDTRIGIPRFERKAKRNAAKTA